MPISRSTKKKPSAPPKRLYEDPAVRKLRECLRRSNETPDVRRKAEGILENYQTLRDEMNELKEVFTKTQNERRSLKLGLLSIQQAGDDERIEVANKKDVLEDELTRMRSMARGLFTGMKDDLALVDTNVRDLHTQCDTICDELEKSEINLKNLGKRKNTIPPVALERLHFLSAAAHELSRDVADSRVQVAKLNYQRSAMKQRHREAAASLSRLRAVTDTSLQDATSQYNQQLRERDQDRTSHAKTIRFLLETMSAQMSKYQNTHLIPRQSQQGRLQAEASVLQSEANHFLQSVDADVSHPKPGEFSF